MNESSIEELAARQLTDLRVLRPGRIFGTDPPVLTMDEAYAVQDAVARLRAEDGERVVGYKVGCTGPGIRKTFGMDGPVRGLIFDSEIHPSGVSLSHARFASLAVEGEIAVRIGPRGEPDQVLPVIELHHYVFRSDPPTLQELVANNAIHAGVVLPADSRPWIGDPPGTIRIHRNGRLLDEGPASGVPGGPTGSLAWLDEHLRNHDRRLEPGQLVLTGTPLGIHAVDPGDEILVTTEAIGTVQAAIVH